MVMLMMIIAPALAPSIGSLILSVAPWRAIFLFLAVYALIVMLALRSWVFPTLAPPTQQATKKISFLRSYLAVLKTPRAIAFVLLQTSTYCILLIFLTHASFIYQVWFHLSKFTFAGLFACNIAMMALLNLSGRFLLRWLEPIQILTLAVFLQAIAVFAWLFFAWFNLSIIFIVPTIMVAIGCISVISPNVQACYLLSFKENSATAAALMGSMQLIIAGLVSLLSVFLANNQLWPIAAVMAGCMLVAIGLMTRVWDMETPA